jgi:hypothetical protein
VIDETVKSIEKEPKYTVSGLKNIFREIDKILKEYFEFSYVARFSDSILIIAPEREDDRMYSSIKKIQILLIENRLLLRGGMAIGNVYVEAPDNRYFDAFGPAINRAHELEQQAIYPRVLLDKSITDRISRYKMSHGEFFEGLELIKDFDEFYFLDYFSRIRSIGDKNKRKEVEEILDNMITESIFNQDINISKKYGWLKTHWMNVKNKKMYVDVPEGTPTLQQFMKERAETFDMRQAEKWKTLNKG